MSELPEGWTAADLDCVIQDYQSGFASGEKDVKGGVPHLRMNNIGVNGELVLELVRTVPESLARSNYDLKKGDVVVCTTNSSKLVGKCALFNLEGRYAFSNHLTRLRPIDELITGSYLARQLWLIWQRGEFEDHCKHWVNQSTLPKEALLKTPILLPPLAEQRRIVAKLETLLGKVDACQQRLAKIPVILKRFRQAVLAAACSGQMTVDWREKNPAQEIKSGSETQSDKTQETIDLPTTWKVTLFKQFIESSFYGPRFSAESYTDIGVPTIRTTDIGFDGSITLIGAPRLSVSAKELEKYGLQQDDLLVTRTGATIGKCALYDSAIGPAIPSAYLIRFRLHRELVFPQYALTFLMSPVGQELLLGGSTAVAQPNVNATTISDFPIPTPPYEEQREIVHRIEVLFKLADQLEARYQKAKAQVDKLQQSILAKAFRGELAPTEAELARSEGRDYEPASVLLERIGSERPEHAQGRKEKVRSQPRRTRLARGAKPRV